MGHKTAYYTESHRKFRQAVRDLTDKLIVPDAVANDNAGREPSSELMQKLGRAGLLALRIGPGKHLQSDDFSLPGGVKPEEFDYFHELICHEETTRIGCPGYVDGLVGGLVIGLPPVINFGSEDLRKTVVPAVLRGDKRICLAISEPFAGSDVANIKCSGVLSEDKTHWIVNGVKKWITSGCMADYFTTAVRTGGEGIGGISLMLIERQPGLTTKKIKTSYSPAAGTAYVIYKDVKVPVGNVLGKVNRGFACIMSNFNHERWAIVAGVVRAARLSTEECLKWSCQRRVFGKALIMQPVIRAKLAEMIARTEAIQNWLENVTYQMNNMTVKEQAKHLAGPIALLKYESTRVLYMVNDNACQIFGGRAITQGGMGATIERFQRSVKYAAILGGSEEIMADLGVRQAMKGYPMNARL